MEDIDLTDVESDCLKEMANVGGGHAVGVVSNMLEAKVRLHVPAINPETSFSPESDEDLLLLHAPIESEHFHGKLLIKMPWGAALKLRNLLTKQKHSTLEPAHEDELRKLGTSVINAYAEALSNFLYTSVDSQECIIEQTSRGAYLSRVTEQYEQSFLVSVSFSMEQQEVKGEFELCLPPQQTRNTLERIKQQFGLI